MENSGLNVLFIAAFLAVLPCLMVSGAPQRPAATGRVATDDDSSSTRDGNGDEGVASISDLDVSYRYPPYSYQQSYQPPHVNSVYSSLPSSFAQKTHRLQRLPILKPLRQPESQQQSEVPEIEGRRSTSDPKAQTHEEEELIIPEIPAFSPELEESRHKGPEGALSLLEQLAPTLW